MIIDEKKLREILDSDEAALIRLDNGDELWAYYWPNARPSNAYELELTSEVRHYYSELEDLYSAILSLEGVTEIS